jgi:hypothetical protein
VEDSQDTDTAASFVDASSSGASSSGASSSSTGHHAAAEQGIANWQTAAGSTAEDFDAAEGLRERASQCCQSEEHMPVAEVRRARQAGGQGPRCRQGQSILERLLEGEECWHTAGVRAEVRAAAEPTGDVNITAAETYVLSCELPCVLTFAATSGKSSIVVASGGLPLSICNRAHPRPPPESRIQ